MSLLPLTTSKLRQAVSVHDMRHHTLQNKVAYRGQPAHELRKLFIERCGGAPNASALGNVAFVYRLDDAHVQPALRGFVHACLCCNFSNANGAPADADDVDGPLLAARAHGDGNMKLSLQHNPHHSEVVGPVAVVPNSVVLDYDIITRATAAINKLSGDGDTSAAAAASCGDTLWSAAVTPSGSGTKKHAKNRYSGVYTLVCMHRAIHAMVGWCLGVISTETLSLRTLLSAQRGAVPARPCALCAVPPYQPSPAAGAHLWWRALRLP
jgi:hypothetical protein